MADTAKNENTVKVPLPIFMGSNMNVNITDLTAKMSDEYLVFYRKIYIGKLPIMQGFVVDKKIYLNYIATRLLNGEPNTPFAIEVYDGSEMIMNVWKMKPHYKLVASDPVIPPFRSLQLRIYTAKSANIGEISILITGFLLLLVIGAGLVTIYRFIQSKVALASKRQDFVSAITHELKTPLTAIKMYAEILQMSKAATEEKKQKYYGLIASESERLSRLIQNVLNLSKLDGNRWNVQLRKGKPKEVLDDFLAGYSKNIENQGFELTVTTDADADKIYLMIDRDAVMQILMNLVDNSLKFSKKAEYKMINIELAIKGNDMYLAVRDYGPGIPPEEMKKVFQEFYRVENEMTRQTSGTGIGLSMVKKLCSLTGMRIEIENAYPGLRTKIHFPSLSF